MHTFHIYRYDPDLDAMPRMQTLEIAAQRPVPVRVHPVRLLHVGMSELLVESGRIRWAGRLAAGLRFLVDSRDTATAERLDNLNDPYRLLRCRSILNCVDVCTKDLLPAGAFGKIKEMMVRRSL